MLGGAVVRRDVAAFDDAQLRDLGLFVLRAEAAQAPVAMVAGAHLLVEAYLEQRSTPGSEAPPAS